MPQDAAFPQIFAYQLLIQFAIVTLILWLMDQHFTKFPDRWDPRKPYGMRHSAMTLPEEGPGIPRVKSASQLIARFVALVWLRAVQHSQFLIFGPAAAFLRLSPGWNQLYLLINALILLEMINAGVSLIRPDNLVVMTSLSGTSDAARVAQIVNQIIYYCRWFAVVIFVVQLAKDVRRIVSGAPHRLPMGQVGQRP